MIPHRPRPVPVSAVLLVGTLLVMLLAGCGGTVAPTGTPAAPPPSASIAPATPDASEPPLTPVPGDTPAAAPSSGEPTTTETDIGPIWDALPPSFPRDPSWTPVEAIEGPVSGAFALGMSAQDAASMMQSALELASYSTFTMSGPFEDGSYVIESVGATPDCLVETRLTPLSGTTHMTVRMLAACPFE